SPPQAAADGVTGQVVGPDAKPVAGADVILFSSWQPHADRVYESRTDEAGRFKIDLGGDHRMPLGAQALVRKAGLAIAASSVPFVKRDAPLTIRLDRAATVSVHVVDPAGKPLAVRRAWL